MFRPPSGRPRIPGGQHRRRQEERHQRRLRRRRVIEAVHGDAGDDLPDDVEVRVTRNYGETADDKVNELVRHLAVAIVIVLALLTFALGWREALIVAVAVPIIFRSR